MDTFPISSSIIGKISAFTLLTLLLAAAATAFITVNERSQPTLANVLTKGNSAGTNNISMNGNYILSIGGLQNCGSNQFVAGDGTCTTDTDTDTDNQNLQEVLTQGNDAGGNDINMSNNDIRDIRSIDGGGNAVKSSDNFEVEHSSSPAVTLDDTDLSGSASLQHSSCSFGATGAPCLSIDQDNGNQVKIRDLAPKNSLVIDGSGNVGFGDETPDASVDIASGNLDLSGNQITGLTSVNARIGTSTNSLSTAVTVKGANVTAVEHGSNYSRIWAPFGMPDSDGVFFAEPTGPNDNKVDLRMHIEDDGKQTERFSIWGASCDGGDCWNVKKSQEFFRFDTFGDMYIYSGNLDLTGGSLEGVGNIVDDSGTNCGDNQFLDGSGNCDKDNSGGTVVFKEDFDDGSADGWTIDNAECGSDSSVRSSGSCNLDSSAICPAPSQSYFLENAGDDRHVSPSFDLSSYNRAELRVLLASESMDSSSEYTVLQVYDGSSWSDRKRISNVPTYGNYPHRYTLGLTPYISSSTQMRITNGGSNGCGDHGFIDEIRVVAWK